MECNDQDLLATASGISSQKSDEQVGLKEMHQNHSPRQSWTGSAG